MRLAIADPPYLGRANRWYGTGRGSSGGLHKADNHPRARDWDKPEKHLEMIVDLERDFDGWAVAASPDSLPLYLGAAPDARVMIWHRRNAPVSGSRIKSAWEPVIVRIPAGRSGRVGGFDEMSDVLDHAAPRIGFAGAKPSAWTRWVLAALGYDPAFDVVVDLFTGSGSVARAAEGMLI